MNILKSKRFWSALGIIIITGVLWKLSQVQCISLEAIQQQHQCIRQFIDQKYAIAVLMYVLGYALIVSFSLPLGSILTPVGGFFFGFIPGTLYAALASTLGGTVAFLQIRYLLGEPIQQRYGAQMARFNMTLNKSGAFYLLLMRFMIVFPFFLVTAFAAVTKIPLTTFVWTTFVGVLPITLVFAYAGTSLAQAPSFSALIPGPLLKLLMILAVGALISMLLFAWYSRTGSKE